MNGAAYGGRLKGVYPLFFQLLRANFREGSLGGSGVGGSSVAPVSEVPSLEADSDFSSSFANFSSSSPSFNESAWRNRMAFGSTETMSPGASRVLAFWCYDSMSGAVVNVL